MNNSPVWIWRDGAAVPHETVLFRRKFVTEKAFGGNLKVSAESDSIAMLDGEELMRGQFSDYPESKTYGDVDVHMQPGSHELLIEVYYCGMDFQTAIAGKPGLFVRLDGENFMLGSDTNWECCRDTRYLRDRLDMVTTQLGMCIGYDAGGKTGDWRPAVAAADRARPRPRPVPLLRDGAPVTGELCAQGLFRRGMKDGSYADCMAADRCFMLPSDHVLAGVAMESSMLAPPSPPWTLTSCRADFDGMWLIFDLGRELTGLAVFDWEFPAGTVVDMAHGEHLADGLVRSRIGGRNFADRYIAGTGRMQWTLPRRIGARYLELHIIPGGDGDCRIYFAGLRPRFQETEPRGEFSCDDIGLMRMCMNSERTLALCMHEHYEDCPWREQALYSYDSRNQMLYGNYLWGNAAFGAASLELLSGGLRPDGLLRLCAPSMIGPPIPAFSLVWITALCEHYLYHGRGDLFGRVEKVVDGIMDAALSRVAIDNGLYLPPDGADVWNFYEWTDGLSGWSERGGKPEVDILYNLYLLEAMDQLAWIAEDGKMQQRADALRQAIYREFYDRGQKAFVMRRGDARLWETVQVLALYNRCTSDAGEREAVLSGIYAGSYIRMELSSESYLFRLLQGEKSAASYMRLRLESDFAAMNDDYSGTMWETVVGQGAFDNAGSLCHGWSAPAIYYFHGVLLGVRPLEPGYRKFVVAPNGDWTDTVLSEAWGEVPTPLGRIRVHIRRRGEKLQVDVTAPEVMEMTFAPPEPEKYHACCFNGKCE